LFLPFDFDSDADTDPDTDACEKGSRPGSSSFFAVAGLSSAPLPALFRIAKPSIIIA